MGMASAPRRGLCASTGESAVSTVPILVVFYSKVQEADMVEGERSQMVKHFLAAVLAIVLTTVSGRAEDVLDRGAYLVKSVAVCGVCHSPVDQTGGKSHPDLSGGTALLSPVFVAYPPNLTPDVETGLGSWSVEQIVTALREGKTPDGRVLRPPMPVPLYRSMSDNDATAIAAYLKSLPAALSRIPASIYKVPTPASYGPPVGHVPEVAHEDHVVYGAYLAKLGHCMQCHTPVGANGQRDYVHKMGAGGLSIDYAWGSRNSANITPDLATGIGRWSDAQIIAAMTQGIRNNGVLLSPIMPWKYFASMRPEDLNAIVAWLRTLKPVSNMVDR